MRDEPAVSDVLGNVLLLAIAVTMSAGFVLLLFTTPPPTSDVLARVDARLDAPTTTAPPRVVLDHAGGAGLAARDLRVLLDVNGTTTAYPIGDSLGATWTLTLPNGTTTATPAARFVTGSTLSDSSPALYGASVNVTIVDTAQNRLILGPLALRARDVTPPSLASATTTNGTSLLLRATEPLLNVSTLDFTVTGTIVTAARVVGNGSIVELDVAPPLATGATPTVTTSSSNHGTRDYATLPIVPAMSVVAADGTIPAFIALPTATASSTSASLTWTTTEATSTFLEYGPTPALGFSRANATLGAAHQEILANLTAGAAAYYRVASTDAAGNANATSVLSFQTSGGIAPKNATSVTIDVPSVPKNIVGCATATLGGTTTTDRVVVTINSQDLGDAFAYHGARISAANTLEVCILNTTGGAVDPAPFVVYVIAY